MAYEELFRVPLREAADAMRALVGVDYRYFDDNRTDERIFYTACDLKRLAHTRFESCPNCGANSWSPKVQFIRTGSASGYKILDYYCDYCGTRRKNDET